MLDFAKWIWLHNEDNHADEYVDFAVEFDLDSCRDVNLEISVDGNFEAYLNGELCAFGSCADYPYAKKCDRFSLDEKCVAGKNQLLITVWHIGFKSSTYAMADAGLIFRVSEGGRTVAVSCEDTPCRRNHRYRNGLCKRITSQLGLSYHYDNTVIETEPFGRSVEVSKSYEITPREIENLRLLPRASGIASDDGKRIQIDLGKEVVGYLDLDFESSEEQEIKIVFGEHLLTDGSVPQIIGDRDFSIGFTAKEGNNRFLGMMRRIAGRYLEIRYEKPIRAEYIGLRPAVYPLNYIEKRIENPLHKRIYDTCAYTLECCMHEHYEDCPWREQALYSLDSRNQMLCGYIAFEEYRFPRYNIVLLAKSLHKGLLRITSPTDGELPIPFFSMTFIQQVYDYIRFSGDRSILEEVSVALDTIVTTFKDLIDESGMIPALKAPAWNFYEWSDGNTGYRNPVNEVPRYDLCLNAMYLYVLPMYEEMRGATDVDKKALADGIVRVLYDSEKGMFKNTSKDGRFSMIGNSLAILAGVGDRALADRMLSERDKVADITLSMNSYFYDALLTFGDEFKDYIIKDLEEKYSQMLAEGATTFWETIDGWHAFSDAGSLCHGWSALPIYYLDLLGYVK